MQETVKLRKTIIVEMLRIALGFVFFWAFIDKTFGLGFATERAEAWLSGGDPSLGFLQYATSGPFAALFQSIADSAVVEWLFMLGLLGIGVALILGLALRFAGYAGALLMVLMWLAVLPPVNNPIIDKHIIYALVLLGLPYTSAGTHVGLREWWEKNHIVKKLPFLR